MMSLVLLPRVQCGRPTCTTRFMSSLITQRGPQVPSILGTKTYVPLKNISSYSIRPTTPYRTLVGNPTLCKITNMFSLMGQRCFARKAKLPFEVDIKVPKDTILYTHTNSQFFKMLSIFGIAQLIFWGQLALFSFTSLDMIDSDSAPTNIDKTTFWGKIIVMQTEYKSRLAALCLTIGSLVTFFTYIYPRRTIRQLILLRGGRDLRVVTYSHFARSRSFTAPVDNLSVQAARAGNASQVSLKIKGHRLFFLMDKRDGKFHDTNLFDYAVGLRRNIK